MNARRKTYRKNQNNIILKGGKKPVKVKTIETKKFIGYGAEAIVQEIKVTIERGKKQKQLELVEKNFIKGAPPYKQPNSREPIKQFKTMQKLLKLNFRKKLGLHIIPTIRLREIKEKKPRLIMTKIKNVVKLKSLNKTEQTRVKKQTQKETDILEKLGYTTHQDIWIYCTNPKTGKTTAWIADFGNIAKKTH